MNKEYDEFVKGVGGQIANRGFIQRKYKRREMSDVKGIIYHSTGPGPNKRFKRGKHSSPMDAALHIYSRLVNAGPHYVIDQEGNVVQTCPLNYASWHTGTKGSAVYMQNKWNDSGRYDWWEDRFPNMKSPRELMGGQLWYSGSANFASIGIEIIPHEKVKEEFSPECIYSLKNLCLHLCWVFNIPFDKHYIISHCEAHPIARTTKSGTRFDTYETNLDPSMFGSHVLDDAICI